MTIRLTTIALACLCSWQASAKLALFRSALFGKNKPAETACESHFRDDRWPVDGPQSADYHTEFKELIKRLGLHEQTNFFEGWIEARHAKGQSVNALDLFGSGFYASNADAMTGLRYGPIRLTKEEEELGYRLPYQVYGDVRLSNTWQDLDRSLSERGLSKFDLVAMRPVRGWTALNFKTPNEELEMIKFIIREVMKRLEVNGEFYFSLMSQVLSDLLRLNKIDAVFKDQISDRGLEMICAPAVRSDVSCVIRARRLSAAAP